MIFDLKWFFAIISKLRLEVESFKEECDYEKLKKLLQEDILDEEQFDLLMQILNQFSEILNINNKHFVKPHTFTEALKDNLVSFQI